MNEQLLTSVDAAGRAILTMNRPEINNAFDDAFIVAMIEELQRLGRDGRVRVILLTGSGRNFKRITLTRQKNNPDPSIFF